MAAAPMGLKFCANRPGRLPASSVCHFAEFFSSTLSSFAQSEWLAALLHS
jgi:hypothetical protein